MSFNISPEEILRQKELLGGIEYDDPKIPKQTGITQNSVEKENIQKEQFSPAPQHKTNTRQEKKEYSEIHTLGKAQTLSQKAETGWKNLPVEILPSKGLFYPEGTRIAIRAAEVREIRYFSTIDEEDRLDIEDKLSYVLERCSRMEFPGEGVVQYKDLKQEDRFFVVLAIRDLTFVKGENSIFLKPEIPCSNKQDCPFIDGIELRTGALSSYEIDSKILTYYDPQRRNFSFDIQKLGKKIEMHVPSIGVTQAISNFVVNQTRKGSPPDESFLKIAPFIFPEWRDLTDSVLLTKMREIDYWTKEEFSLVFELSERIKIGTELQVKQDCPNCGAKGVTAEISFPQGLRSLFLISNIFRELL